MPPSVPECLPAGLSRPRKNKPSHYSSPDASTPARTWRMCSSSAPPRLALLVDQQWTWRENQALARRLKTAKLRGPACVEDIDYRTARGLDQTVVRALAKDWAWVRNHENIFVLGPTGVGKSFIASALAQKACRDGYSALYLRAAALLRELAVARADGSLRHFLARLGRIDVLVIDDWAMAPLNENERREVWEICEDRYQTRSTILTSQLPISRWHEQIGDPTIADGILDRLVHNAHRIEMRGESMRKKRNPPQGEKKATGPSKTRASGPRSPSQTTLPSTETRISAPAP
jgi:DNA replication protein DnaC